MHARRRKPDIVAQSLEPRVLLAASVVTDLDPTPADSDPKWITAVGGTTFFSADTSGTGRELWKSDGTPGGTVLVKDARRGPPGSDPSSLINLDGTVLFIATSDDGSRGLWRSDGTAAGTFRVTDAVRFGGLSYVADEQPLVAYKGAAYFGGAGADGTGVELWRSDGTAAGTYRLKDINRAGDSRPGLFTEVSGKLYFTADDGTHGGELWVTDGTAAGTVMVEDIRPGNLSSYASWLARAGDLLFFTARDADNPAGANALWRSDGTAGGTFKLLDPQDNGFSELQGVGDTLYFVSGNSNGSALWKSDGTVAGTRRVADYRSFDLDYGYVAELTEVGGSLDYRVLRAAGPAELWTVAPGSDGPVRLESFPRTPGGVGLDRLTSVGGRLFFTAFSEGAGMELWTTDGSPGGARRVKDIAPGPDSSHPLDFADVGGVAYFAAHRADSGRELWRSDGTEAGTVLVKDVDPGTRGSDPRELEDLNGTLFFTNDSLYKVKPTQDSVELIFQDYGLGNISTDLTASGDTLYFGAYQIGPVGGPWLMKSDGTASGTVEVDRDVWVQWITDLDHGGTVLFAASFRDGELWRSDGTAAGTVRVKDINPGGQSNPSQLVNLNGTVYFSADDGSSGSELWKSDGTEAGTVRVKDIVPGPTGSNPLGLVPVGNQVFFRVNLPGGTELWKSDGTDAGTVRVAAVGSSPAAAGGLFSAGDWQRGAALGDTLVFAAADPAGGVELWRSDGTEAGTFRIKDIEPGAVSSDPTWFTSFEGRVYFGAYDSAGGRELWSTDGTASGTVRAEDLNPGVPSSDPAWLTVSGGALWFSAISPLYGRELWKFTADAPVPSVVGRHVFYNNSVFDRVLNPRSAGQSGGDDDAVAPDKTALLPGDRATFANVTSYSRGINGVMIDVKDLPPGPGPTPQDFGVRLLDGGRATWRGGPLPSVIVRRGAGAGGSDRLTLIWHDYNPASASAVAQAVVNGWLEVTLRNTSATGLAAPDVSYFGNLVGEAGDRVPAAPTPFAVGGPDLSLTRRALFSAAPIESRVDFNRDGYVSAADFSLCRANLTTRLARLAPPIPRGAVVQTAPQLPSTFGEFPEASLGRVNPRRRNYDLAAGDLQL